MRKTWMTAAAALGAATALAVGLTTATGATRHAAGARAADAPSAIADLGRALGTGFTAKMTGSVEVPAGDPNASGSAKFRLNVAEGLVCFHIVVNGANAPIVAAHIHQAAAGSAGPVVVPLIAPSASAGDASVQQSKGCVAAAPALIRQIIATPSQFYVNVHNKNFPAGVVRGQLVRLKEKPLKPKPCSKPKKTKNR
jgi:hypothetical protein